MRIALISPQFWPLCDPVARHAGEFAAAASRLGVDCTVFTAHRGNEQPVPYYRQGFRVSPVKPAPTGGRNDWKFARNLTAAIQSQGGAFDAVYIYGVHEAAGCIVAKMGGGATPIVIRSMRVGPMGDAAWPHQGICRQRLRGIISGADLVIGSSEVSLAEWGAAGVASDRLKQIPFGVSIDASAMSQNSARTLLAETHPLFLLPEGAKLALLFGDLTLPRELRLLPKVWSQLRQRFPDAYLWLLGEGPASKQIWREIGRYDLEQFILLPGQFDDTAPVFHAADIVLEPGQVLENELPLLEAMAHHKPVLASAAQLTDETLRTYPSRLPIPHLAEPGWIDAVVSAMDSEPLSAKKPAAVAPFSVVDEVTAVLQAVEEVRRGRRVV